MTSSLLTTHLEQISLCAASIAELPFPGPKQFTNALLALPSFGDITALIRDTEAHERALFSLAPLPIPSSSNQAQQFTSSLSASANPRANPTFSAARQPRRDTAVAAVLGRDLYRQIKDTDDGKARAKPKADVDVDLLLEGAEKLCNV